MTAVNSDIVTGAINRSLGARIADIATRVQAEQGVVQARAGLTNSVIAVQKALGLGWDSPAAQ